jgi:hypothetical protein
MQRGIIRPGFTIVYGRIVQRTMDRAARNWRACALAGNFTLTLGQHSQGADGVAADKLAGATEVGLPTRMLRHICARTALGAPVMCCIFRYRYV